MSPRAIVSRRFMPPERCSTRAPRPVRQLDELQKLGRPLADLARRNAEVPAVDDEVLEHRQLEVEVVLLRHDAEALADLRAVVRRIEVEDRELTPAARRDGADHAHGRRLAGAVRPEEAERLAARHLEVDSVDGDELAEALLEVAGDDWRRRWSRASRLAKRPHLTTVAAVCEIPYRQVPRIFGSAGFGISYGPFSASRRRSQSSSVV